MNLTNYSFYDFIKYNSVNYDKLFVKIEKENEEYLKQVEEEEEKELNDEMYELEYR
jgi:hypothetical protein